MSTWVTQLLYSSFSASLLIGAVLLVRVLIARRAPRWVACLLWALVGIRLLVPLSIESELSIVPELTLPEEELQTSSPLLQLDTIVSREEMSEAVNKDLSFETSEETSFDTVSEQSKPDADESETEESREEVSVPVIVPPIGGNTSREESADSFAPSEPESDAESIAESTSEDSFSETESEDAMIPLGGTGSSTPKGGDIDIYTVAGIVWACGIGVLFLCIAVQYVLLRRRVAVFSVQEDGTRRCEMIDTPFVLGFFRPRIYLPFGLSREAESHIIAHERAHICRLDHWSKLAAFLALAVHWFNPLVWVAFLLFCKDIEYACDEKVVREMNTYERKAYATALLTCSVRQNVFSAFPVAFGVIGVKARIKNALSYKKPVLWIMIVCILLCAVLAVFFLTDPKSGEDTPSDEPSEEVSSEMSEEQSAPENSGEESADVSEGETSSEAESSVEDSSEDEESSELAELNYTRVNSYIDSSYDAEDSKVLSAVYGEQYAVCFPDWEQYAVIDGELICAAVTGNTALGFGYEKGETHPDGYSLYNIRLYRFAKGSDEVEESTIELPKGCIYHMMFYSAITRDSGYLAVFETEYESSQRHVLSYLLFTADGGETWQTVDTIPLTSDPKDCPLMLRFVNENTGVLSFSYQNVPSVAERTYITTDGGKTWNSLQGLTGIEHEEESEAVDLTFQGGVYTLTLRTPPEKTQCYQYVSADLQSWTPADESPEGIVRHYKSDNLDELEFEPFGETDPESDSAILYARDGKAKILYISAWDEYIYFANDLYLSGGVSGDHALFVSYDLYYSSETCKLYRLTKGEPVPEELVLACPEDTEEILIKLSVLDGNIAYLTWINTVPATQTSELKALYKTTDGGDTWNEVTESNASVNWNWKSHPHIVHFFDEQTAIISCTFAVEETLEQHTFVTKDGGKTWSCPNALDYGYEYPVSEIVDYGKTDDQFWIKAVVHNRTSGVDTSFMTFVSTDLINWSLSKTD